MPIVQQGGTSAASSVSSQGIAIDSILSRLARECGDRPPDGGLALNWLEDRYRQAWSASDWSFALKYGTFQTVAIIQTGTVNVTNASTTVTEYIANACAWTSDVEGRYIRFAADNEYYGISAYADANPDTLTLDRAYEGTTGTDVSYTIFQNIYSLADDVGKLLGVSDLNEGQPLTEVNRNWMDMVFPNRPSYGNPRIYAQAGRDANDIVQIELYYIPSEVHGLKYQYVQEAPYLTSGDQKTVPQVFESCLKHGWKADYWRWRGTMDDATGQEGVWSSQEEMLFSKELAEMCMREAQNKPPQKLRLATRYTRHRAIRGSPFWGV